MTATTNVWCRDWWAAARALAVLGCAALAAWPAMGEAHAQTAMTANATAAAAGRGALAAAAHGLFGSLMTDRVEARSAPGLDHAVTVIFKRAGLPVRLLEASRDWLRVEDRDGTKGWVRADMVSRRRTALAIAEGTTAAQAQISVRAAPQSSADALALLEPGVIVGVTSCDGQMCKVSAGGVHGFITQTQLWGVDATETF